MDRKLKLLYLNYEYPPLGGGGGTTTKYLAEHMASTGHYVYIFTSGIKGHLGIAKEQKNLIIERINIFRKKNDSCTKWEMLKFIFKSILLLQSRIKKVQPDLIHIFFSFPTGGIMWFYRYIVKIPYVISLLGADVPGFLPKELNFFHNLIKPFTIGLWRGAKFVIPNSSGLSKLAQKTFDMNFVMIPNGVDNTTFFPIKRQNTSVMKMLFIGRLIPQKGLDVLLKALYKIKSNLPHWKLTIVGQGPYYSKYQELANKYNLNDNLEWKGWLDFKQIPELYRMHDIFILPSRFEGMASVVLQAMASGCAIISSDVFGAEELVKDGKNGYIVPVEDDTALSEKILEIYRNNNYLKFAEYSYQLSKKFHWKYIGQRYENLYYQSINGY